VRQQATWFRADDPTITWFDASVSVAGPVCKRVTHFLAVEH